MLFLSMVACGESAARLDSAHPGWKNPLCTSAGCHATPHDGQHQPPACIDCHGRNGAPPQQHATLEQGPCDVCHYDVDHVDAFEVPHQCIGCHGEQGEGAGAP